MPSPARSFQATWPFWKFLMYSAICAWVCTSLLAPFKTSNESRAMLVRCRQCMAGAGMALAPLAVAEEQAAAWNFLHLLVCIFGFVFPLSLLGSFPGFYLHWCLPYPNHLLFFPTCLLDLLFSLPAFPPLAPPLSFLLGSVSTLIFHVTLHARVCSVMSLSLQPIPELFDLRAT